MRPRRARSVAQLSAQPELGYLIISQDQRDQSYSTVKTTSPAVTVNNLKPGTLYIFQIRTSSSPDYAGSSPSIEVETLAERKWCPGWALLQPPAASAASSRAVAMLLLLLPQTLPVLRSSICASGSAASRLRADTSRDVLLVVLSRVILADLSWRCR